MSYCLVLHLDYLESEFYKGPADGVNSKWRIQFRYTFILLS
jgi:hypothetical protein